MKKVLGAVLGAAGGSLVLGVVGYLYGELFLLLFGPRDCCGLEGLLAPIVGTVIGTTLGLTVGAMTGILIARRRPLKPVRLVLFLIVGVALSWLLSLVMGPFDVERLPGPIFFFALTMVIPMIGWVTDVWEKPDTSI
ncbi:MAG: hypothetical protein QOG04_397 [Actinomycetota bacterium]|jgi:hypothetical protein|nr:hypothetical protein [Actinomycetota bacterium]